MSQAESWTVGRLLIWTAEYLKKHASESPRLEAELLLAHVRGCERIQLYTSYEENVNEAERNAFRELVKRRAAGVPVAYLLQRREFYSLALRVSPAVLIPRPETEFAVIAVLDHLKTLPSDHVAEIIDIGTGSGAIAIAVAKHALRTRVTAIDLSREALEVAQENIAAHNLADRVSCLESDLFAAVPSDRKFDVVISNPPYVSESEFESLAPDVRDHEPYGALVSGPLGTEIIAKIIPQAAERLRTGGLLAFELSPMIAEASLSLVRADGRFAEPRVVKDLAGSARIVTALRL